MQLKSQHKFRLNYIYSIIYIIQTNVPLVNTKVKKVYTSKNIAFIKRQGFLLLFEKQYDSVLLFNKFITSSNNERNYSF